MNHCTTAYIFIWFHCILALAHGAFWSDRGLRYHDYLHHYLHVFSNFYIHHDHWTRIQDIIHKIWQYADDTILFLPFDVQSIDATFHTFEQFQAISGLKINFNKTEIFPLGPLKEIKMSLYNRGKVKWSQDGVKALGIHITHDSKTLIAKTLTPL